MATLIGNEVPSPRVKRTQVYNLTREGADKLPLRDRAFISFSYGGRAIEDFNLIATFQSDRLQRAAYAQFEDITTTYEVVDGQFYWGTHFLNNTLDFTLSTDGMSDNELRFSQKLLIARFMLESLLLLYTLSFLLKSR